MESNGNWGAFTDIVVMQLSLHTAVHAFILCVSTTDLLHSMAGQCCVQRACLLLPGS